MLMLTFFFIKCKTASQNARLKQLPHSYSYIFILNNIAKKKLVKENKVHSKISPESQFAVGINKFPTLYVLQHKLSTVNKIITPVPNDNTSLIKSTLFLL